MARCVDIFAEQLTDIIPEQEQIRRRDGVAPQLKCPISCTIEMSYSLLLLRPSFSVGGAHEGTFTNERAGAVAARSASASSQARADASSRGGADAIDLPSGTACTQALSG